MIKSFIFHSYQVEKKGNEELKTIEQGGISPSKENNVIEGEEKAKAEESASVKAPTESKEVENTQIVTPANAEAENVEKFDETPDLYVLVTDGSQLGASPDSKLDISSVPDSVVEAVVKEAEESSKTPDVTESSIEALDKPVELLESPTKDSEPEVGKKPEEVFVEELNTVEKPESVAEVEVKPQEQFEEVEEIYLTLEPNESVDKDITTDSGTKADESLEGEVLVMGSKMEEKLKPVVEAGGKPQEVDISSFPDSIVEAVGKDPEESSKIPDITESSIESLHKPVELLESPTNDSEPKVGKKPAEVFVEELNTLEKQESVAEVEVKLQKQFEEVEEKYLMLEPHESVDKDITADAGTKADESLEGEVLVMGSKMEEKLKPVVEAGGKPQEVDISSFPDSIVEAVGKDPEESSKIPDITESSIESLHKPVELLESPTNDSEPKVGKKPAEVFVEELNTLEKQESVAEVEVKLQKQFEEVEEKYLMLEPHESVDKDITADAGTKADESLEGEVSVMGSKMEEKLKPVVEAGGKPQEVDIFSFPESIVEAVGKEPEESSKVPDVTESSIESLHKPVELLESPTNDSEPEVGKKPEEVSVEEPKVVEKPESVVEVKVKPPEESEEAEEKYMTLEPNVDVDKDVTTDAGTKADESLEGEISVVGPKMEEKAVGGKPREAEEVEEKYEMLKPRESIDNDSGKDGVTQEEESLKEEASVVEPETLEKSEPVVEMGGKPQEKAQEVEKKSEMIDPKESLDSDIPKDDLTDIVEEDIKPSESVASASQGAESGLKEGGIKPVTPDAENVNVDDTKKEVGVEEEKAAVHVGDIEAKKEEKVVNMEEGKDNDVKIEELTQPEKTETIEEKEAKDVKIDENEENGIKKEQLMLPEPTETKDVGGSYTATEVTEKYSNEQSASKDAEITTQEKKEHDAKVDTPDLKGKVDVVETSNFVEEPTSESKESDLEGKVEEAVQSCVHNLDGVAVDESAKSGAPNVELSKLMDNSKTDQDPPKQEAPAKPSQKHSNNIISKVKQSIVKVKKAIIGKSPSSKPLSSESKGDVQTK
ncbi:titin-like isoform X2 [Macadamia integrifolia]|uniref:titin-like isoform X2 n=1 Tax=Macadamia integrifolia TaxID=60698 RepID=UPI001C4E9E81|nr:titin-like isoform X2 [Macadamia integrifolia]XP_042483340.1 titin-like isoform X2 [Macadamia integrifolia]